MITSKEFKAILEIIVPRLILKISNDKSVGAEEALRLLYFSHYYSMLEQESTKLWHLSIPMQYELWNEELTTGKITFPIEV